MSVSVQVFGCLACSEKSLVATGLRNLHLHINHAPALGGNSSIHDFAGRWWLELLAILAALVALWSVLVLHGFLRRLGLRARHT